MRMCKVIETTMPAQLEKWDDASAFLSQELEKIDCPMKAQTQLLIAAEEIFVNVCHYAYPSGECGIVRLRLCLRSDALELSILDSGTPYNPLDKPDPNIHLSASERIPGGLGIYMTKKLMDKLDYRYEDGQNILTMHKYWS